MTDFLFAFTKIMLFGYAGIAAHVLLNASAINNDSLDRTFSYVLKRYWQIERLRILLAILIITVVAGASDELLPLKLNAIVDAKLPADSPGSGITGTLAAFTKLLAFLLGMFMDLVIYWLNGKVRRILRAESVNEGKDLAQVVRVADLSKNPYPATINAAGFMFLAIPRQDFGIFVVGLLMAVLCIVIDWQKSKTSFEAAFKDAPIKYVAIAVSPVLFILFQSFPLWLQVVALCASVYIGMTFIKTVIFKR